MLPLSGEAAVICDDGPAVFKGATGIASCIENRLHGKRHSWTQFDVGKIVCSEVEHRWLFVEVPSDSMPRVVLHHTELIGFDVIFDCSSDVEKRIAGTNLGESSHQ